MRSGGFRILGQVYTIKNLISELEFLFITFKKKIKKGVLSDLSYLFFPKFSSSPNNFRQGKKGVLIMRKVIIMSVLIMKGHSFVFFNLLWLIFLGYQELITSVKLL